MYDPLGYGLTDGQGRWVKGFRERPAVGNETRGGLVRAILEIDWTRTEAEAKRMTFKDACGAHKYLGLEIRELL